jgi:magnesium transporter
MADPDTLTAADAQPDPPAPEAVGTVTPALVEAAAETIRVGDAERLRALCGGLHEADLGELLQALDPELRSGLVELLGTDFHFAALTEVDEAVRLEVLENLPADDRQLILELLPLPERTALTRSLDFPEESAGRRMQTDFIAVPPFWTVGRTVDYLREMKDAPETFYAVYVIDPSFKLLGIVQLDKLLRAPREARLEAVLNDEVREIKGTEDQEEAGRLFQRYNLVSAPVTDNEGRLVGVLTIDDIVDVIHEEADEDIKALGGVMGDEELSDTVTQTARSRFPWLLINLGTAFLAAAVIGLFEGTIEQMVALAILMPIVASMGGNAGTQAMTVTVRAIAMRELGARNIRRIITREILVGLLNGAGLAVLLGIGAGIWFENWQLGAVIAAALVINMLVAGLFGTVVPITVNRLKWDPAVASGVFVTTLTDVIGFLAFLGLATWWFRLA